MFLGIKGNIKGYKGRHPGDEVQPVHLKAALWKYHRSINVSEDSAAQIIDVESIDYPPGFTGYQQFYTDVIAIVTLKTPVKYTRNVRPVCIDVGSEKFEEDQLVKGAMGKVVGWKISKAQDSNDTLMMAELPFVPWDECSSKLSVLSGKDYLATDKICAGDTNSSVQRCRSNSGGGLVFEDSRFKTYYLRGVVPIETEQCTVENYMIFIKLSSHKKFVEKYLDDCKKVCKQTCGVSASNYAPLITTNQRQAEFGEFPWHAIIYQHNATSGSYDQLCGGTLISSNAVISSAQCFTTEQKEDDQRYYDEKILTTLKVALGKYHRTFNTREDDLAQIVDVKSIEFSSSFIIKQTNDIAVLTLKTRIKYTRAVRPVCTDIGSDNFELDQLKTGKTVQLTDTNDTIVVEELKLVLKNSCEFASFDSIGLQVVTADIICAGEESRNSTSCKNYLGEGLVFEEPKTRTYYLRGIGTFNAMFCNASRYSNRFKKVSAHKDLVEKYLDDCKRRCRKDDMIYEDQKNFEGLYFVHKPTTDRCNPLFAEKLHIICLAPSGQSIRCDKPLPNNAKAIFNCNSLSYMEIKKSEYNIINCQNGHWDRPLKDDFCIPAYAECGKPVSKLGQPNIFNGKQTEFGDFSWHAGIYEYSTKLGTFEQSCGGTLISHKVVISAAHCFEIVDKENRKIYLKDLSTIKIALGKFHRTLNSSDDPLAEIIDPENIEILMEYRSHMAQYINDIAFITLKREVEYTNAIRPVCIDVGPDSFEDDQLIKGAVGEVVGWGLTQNKEPTNKLILAEMPFVPKEECVNTVGRGLLGFVTNDKLCAGDKSSKVTVCDGDSGGGLVFENPRTKTYYLRGIVSVGPKPCTRRDLSLYTKLSSHANMLEKYLRL